MIAHAVVFKSKTARDLAESVRILLRIFLELDDLFLYEVGVLYIPGIELEVFFDAFFGYALERGYDEGFCGECIHVSSISLEGYFIVA